MNVALYAEEIKLLSTTEKVTKRDFVLWHLNCSKCFSNCQELRRKK